MLELRNLKIEFEGGFAVTANLQIVPGTWTSILGPSGSGKTTLIQAIAGFVLPTAGDVVLDGSSLLKLKPSQRPFAIVFQKDTLFEHLNIEDNLLLAMHDSGFTKPKKRALALELLTNVQLEKSFLKRFPTTLSGGQRARVSVARALARGAKWLILDESFSALDERLRLELHFWLEELRLTQGLTILSVTHQQIEARLFSDTLVAMNMGQVIFCGAPSELEQHAIHSGKDFILYEPFLLERSQVEEDGRVIYLEGKSHGDTVQFIFDEENLKKHSKNRACHLLREPHILTLGKRFVLRERGRRTLVYFTTPLAKPPIAIALEQTIT